VPGTYKDAGFPQRPVARRSGALEGVVVNGSVLVTGAYGLLGGWLVKGFLIAMPRWWWCAVTSRLLGGSF